MQGWSIYGCQEALPSPFNGGFEMRLLPICHSLSSHVSIRKRRGGNHWHRSLGFLYRNQQENRLTRSGSPSTAWVMVKRGVVKAAGL